MRIAKGRVELTCCVSVDYDMKFLPHFIKHYTPLVDKFSFIFHSSKDFNLDTFSDVYNSVKWVGRFNGIDKVDMLNELSVKSKYDYILTSDIDEFQIWDKKTQLKDQSIVWGKLRDREPEGETLPEITSENIFKQFPLITNRTKWGLQLNKPCLFPAGMKLSTPHNLVGMEIDINPSLIIEHFRWAKGRLEKSEERLTNYRQLNKEGKKWTHQQNIYRNLPITDLVNRISELKGKDLI